jgi:hypothetical protein
MSLRKILLASLAVVLCGAIVAVAFLWATLQHTSQDPATFEQPQKTQEIVDIQNRVDTLEPADPELRGNIFMTLAAKNTTPVSNYPMVYDVSSADGMGYTGTNIRKGESSMLVVSQSFSPDYTSAVFLGRAGSDVAVNATAPLQIYTARDVDITNNEATVAKLQSAKKMTKNAFAEKTAPSINNNAAVLYAALTKTDTTQSRFYPVDDYSIYLVDKNGVEKRVTTGSEPKWVTNTQFVFLKNTGVYVYDFLAQKEALLLPDLQAQKDPDYVLKNNAHLAVSRDGSLLAVTSPDTLDINVFTISSWSTLEFKRIGYIENVVSFWPVFSHDNLVLAAQTANAKDIQNNPQPKLEFWVVPHIGTAPTQMKKMSYSLDLDAYYQDTMFISDWIM